MIIYDCVLTNTAPDDTVDELDFSLFTSSEFSYDALADLSLTLDDSDMEVVIDITVACPGFEGGRC